MTNAATAFLDERIAAGDADRAAITTPTGTTTYAELLALASRAGNGLRTLGVESEQRVAILLPDSLEWAAVFLGALRLGAVAVPLNTRLTPAEWAAMLRDSRATVLITDADAAERLADARPALPSLRAVVATAPAAGCLPLADLLRVAVPRLGPEPVGAEAMALWLYTSGTTGAPRAAVHLHRDLLACRHYGLEVLGAAATDRVFATSRLFFAYALGNALLIPFYVGGCTFLHPAWPEPALVAQVMAGFRPTLFFSVPTFYARLARAELPPDTFRSVRCAVSAGERLPPEIHGAILERYRLEILDGMGATETIFMVLSNRPGASRPGSSGLPVPGTEARLVDGEGREVPDGREGVLQVRTPSASPCYWNRPEESRRTFHGEWFTTGDVYLKDADGFYHHRGRADDRFKVAGQWVSPADVESTLLAHPGVAEAGVVGLEDRTGLVKPFAFVVARGAEAGGLADALARLCEETLAPHQRPRKIVIVSALPRTATGKLQRYVLREQARACARAGARPGAGV